MMVLHKQCAGGEHRGRGEACSGLIRTFPLAVVADGKLVVADVFFLTVDHST